MLVLFLVFKESISFSIMDAELQTLPAVHKSSFPPSLILKGVGQDFPGVWICVSLISDEHFPIVMEMCSSSFKKCKYRSYFCKVQIVFVCCLSPFLF